MYKHDIVVCLMPAYMSQNKKVSFSIVLHIHVCVGWFVLLLLLSLNKNGGGGGGVTLSLNAKRSPQAPAALRRLRGVVAGATAVAAV